MVSVGCTGWLYAVSVGVLVGSAACVMCMYTHLEYCVRTPTPHYTEAHCFLYLLRASPPPTPWGVHTDSFAVLGQCVHLIARVALALKVALVIDTDLAAGVWILALVYVWGEEQRSELAGGSASAWGRGGQGLTAAGLLVQEPVACRAGALKADLEVIADVGAAAIVVQTLVQPWKGTRAPEGPEAQPGVGTR